jgi:glycerol-3-phosphate dehydrogenase
MQLDVVIFGGGAAGLWILDRLARQGHSVVLLEAGELGAGQTIASQGIIHGGLKYALQGLMNRSAASISEMPLVWRASLLGQRSPCLTNTRLRSGACYLWRTENWSSRLGMLGARLALQVQPEALSPDETPDVLRHGTSTAFRLGEQVICPKSFVTDLYEQHAERILKIDAAHGLHFEIDSPGETRAIRLQSPDGSRELVLKPRHVVLAAGRGNRELRGMLGLSRETMQTRPLKMVVARGSLPELHGHCIDGAKTRVTITSDCSETADGRTVWQIGGQLAEDGVAYDDATQLTRAIAEIHDVLPGLDLTGVEWSCYRVDRAEKATTDGQRPEGIQTLCAGNVTTAWPTKLALAPVLADEVASRIGDPRELGSWNGAELADWPRPEVARFPWELPEARWFGTDELDSTPGVTRRAA